MDLSTEPGFPQIACVDERTPTTIEWEELRPYLSYAYKKKQHTARMILHELKEHNFVVSENVLRNRFKLWRVDDKYKRRTSDPTVRNRTRSDEATSPDKDQRNRSVTPENRSSSTTRQTPQITEEASLLNESSPSQSTSPQNSVPAIDSLDRYIARMSTPDREQQMQHLFGAMGAWYDRLAYFESQTHAECSIKIDSVSEIYTQIASGLSMISHSVNKGWNQLRQTGHKISIHLQPSDPAILAVLLDGAFIWRNEGVENQNFKPIVSPIFTLLLRTSRCDLGDNHPVTDAINSLICDRMSPETGEMLVLQAIALSHPRSFKANWLVAYEKHINKMFGRVAADQGADIGFVQRLAAHSGDQVALYRAPTADAHAFIVLAGVRRRRGRYLEAEEAVARAWDCLAYSGLHQSRTACNVLKRHAWLKEKLNDWAACVQLFERYLQTAALAGVEDAEINYVAVHLDGVHQRQGNLRLAGELSSSYPETLSGKTPALLPSTPESIFATISRAVPFHQRDGVWNGNPVRLEY